MSEWHLEADIGLNFAFVPETDIADPSDFCLPLLSDGSWFRSHIEVRERSVDPCGFDRYFHLPGGASRRVSPERSDRTVTIKNHQQQWIASTIRP